MPVMIIAILIFLAVVMLRITFLATTLTDDGKKSCVVFTGRTTYANVPADKVEAVCSGDTTGKKGGYL